MHAQRPIFTAERTRDIELDQPERQVHAQSDTRAFIEWFAGVVKGLALVVENRRAQGLIETLLILDAADQQAFSANDAAAGVRGPETLIRIPTHALTAAGV